MKRKQKRTKYTYIIEQKFDFAYSFKSFKLAVEALKKEVEAGNKVEIFRVERA